MTTDDVPAQLVLHPPTTDVECSEWGSLAPTLYHQGLIWRDFEQTVEDRDGPKLRIWCTFTDRDAFDTWRSNPTIKERCADVLTAPIEISVIETPWAKHEKMCRCPDSPDLMLRGHGFGNAKAKIYCGRCSGYFPKYRVNRMAGDLSPKIESWSIVAGHVCHIWLLTAELEEWAFRELTDPASFNKLSFSRIPKNRTANPYGRVPLGRLLVSRSLSGCAHSPEMFFHTGDMSGAG